LAGFCHYDGHLVLLANVVFFKVMSKWDFTLFWRTRGICRRFFCILPFRFVNFLCGKRDYARSTAASHSMFYVVSCCRGICKAGGGCGRAIVLRTPRSFFIFTDAGTWNLAYTVLIGILAHGVLLFGWYLIRA